MKLKVLNIEGKETGRTVVLNERLIPQEPNDHAIYLDVKRYLATRRQGTHKSKERGEVKASTRKIKRQKGTGTARAGSIASPLFRGGGRTFGPRPRSYDMKLNKKVKRLARCSALAYKLKENQLIVVEDFSLEVPKTREIVKIKDNLNIGNKKSLFVLPESDKNIYLSFRNLPGADVITINNLATYDLMHVSAVVFSEKAIEILNASVES
ncbi:MAG TPA: 50S ribosomal protein L4 [Bacteroidetes bacterium]|nr:50S ribosomal protein L4 [Bacteroidota bacterium]